MSFRRSSNSWSTAAILACLLVASCTSDGGALGPDGFGPAKHVVVDEGSGEANAEPLFPVRPGMTLWEDHGEVVAYVGRRIRVDELTVLPLSGAGQVDWYSFEDGDLYYHGNSHAGRKPRPMLWVPAEVRSGMRWRVWLEGDEPALEAEVVAVDTQDTLWGRSSVWTIRREDLRYGDVRESTYVEGRGPIGGGPTAGVLPLVDAEEAPPSRLALEPLHGGEPIVEELWMAHLSVVEDGDPEGLQLRLDGRSVDRSYGGAIEHRDITACLRLAGASLTPMHDGQWQSPDKTDCKAAEAMVFDADGAPVGRPLGFQAAVKSGGGGTFLVDGEPFSLSMGPAGFEVLSWRPFNDSDSVVQTGPTLRPLARRGGGRPTSFVMPAEVSTAGFGLGVRMGSEVHYLRFDGRTFVDPGPGLVLGGQLSAILTPEGRRVFANTHDGRVEELWPSANRLEVRHIADLEMPEGHVLVGAVVHGERILAVTVLGQAPSLRDEADLGATYAWEASLGSAGDLTALDARGAVHVRTQDADVEVCWPKGAGPGTFEGWTLAGEPVTARASRLDGTCAILLRDPSGAVDLGTNGAYSGEGELPGLGRIAFGVAGPELDMPALGDVLPGVDPGSIVVATADGQLVSTAYIYSPSGAIVGAPPNADHNEMGWTVPMFPDLGGGGLWHVNGDSNPCYAAGMEPCRVLTFTGAPEGRLNVPRTNGINDLVVSSAGGGGLLVKWHEELGVPIDHPSKFLFSHLRPDGTFDDLPELAGYSSRWDVVTADGTACRAFGQGPQPYLECVDATGTEFQLFLPEGSSPGHRVLPLPDGSFYWYNEGVTLHWLDPAAGTVLTMPPQAASSEHLLDTFPSLDLVYDGKGRLYAVAELRAEQNVVAGWSLVRLDPGEVVVLDASPVAPLFPGTEVPEFLAISRDCVLFGGGSWGKAKLLRPDTW